MKKILLAIFFLVQIITAQENGIQVYTWDTYVGASAVYPHYMTITDRSIATHKNIGFAFHLGYNFTEHFGFRVSPNYVLLNSTWNNEAGEEQDNHVNMGSINIDAVYNILPCQIISPFIIFGYGFTYFKSSNPYLGPDGNREWIKESFTGNQLELGFGANFKFWDDISLVAEANYITATNNKIDGNEHTNENKGILQSNGDSYMNLSLGAIWYFWRGEKSKICDPFTIKEVITEVPVEVEKIIIDTVYIDNVVEKAVIERRSFVLEKVKFKFDQDILTKEAQMILDNVAKIFMRYPEEKFEIIGHTDSWGSDEYNLDLSERRALSVKKYLIERGIDPSRLFTAGCGERMPIADNSTYEGRAINRRIEFSLYDGESSKCPPGSK
jgi:OOP family OmpA-OmpF porin